MKTLCGKSVDYLKVKLIGTNICHCALWVNQPRNVLYIIGLS
jgi:hypothetical protein